VPYKQWDLGIQRRQIGIRGRLSIGRRTGGDRGWRAIGQPVATLSGGSRTPSLRFLQIRYRLNSLRVLTFLVRVGFPRPWAMAIARWWDGVRHPWARGGQ
jgi:hypothetical protein